MDEQREKYKQFRYGLIDPERDMPYIVLIFDDVISDESIKHNKLINTVAFNARHYFVFCIICSQDAKG